MTIKTCDARRWGFLIAFAEKLGFNPTSTTAAYIARQLVPAPSRLTRWA